MKFKGGGGGGGGGGIRPKFKFRLVPHNQTLPLKLRGGGGKGT